MIPTSIIGEITKFDICTVPVLVLESFNFFKIPLLILLKFK